MAKIEDGTSYLVQLRTFRADAAYHANVADRAYHMNGKTAAKILAASDAKGMLQRIERIDGFPVVVDEDVGDDKVYFVRPLAPREVQGGATCPIRT